MTSDSDSGWLRRACELAEGNPARGEVPVGAVLVHEGEIIGEAANSPIADCDPSAHAEMLALRQGAKRLGNYRLNNTVLYVTLEPCVMCAGAMVHARVRRLVYALADPRAGAAGSVMDVLGHPSLNHQVETRRLPAEDPLAQRSADLLRSFFQERRRAK